MTFSERSKIPLDPIYTGKMFWRYENDREQLFSATYLKNTINSYRRSSRNWMNNKLINKKLPVINVHV
jgi:hypothetical protein